MTTACPYCGHPARLAAVKLWSIGRQQHCHALECSHKDCEATGPLRPTPQEAEAAWNHRPPPKPQTPTQRQQQSLL